MVMNGGGHRLSELVFLSRGPLVVRALAVIVAAAGCGVAGDALLRWHQALAARAAAGASLNPIESLVATGSSPRTLWIGWVAAAFFFVALVRLTRGPMEPSVGRGSAADRSVAQLRAGLRREYVAVRLVLILVLLIAGVDAARAIALALAVQRAGGSPFTLWPTDAEALGLCVAGVGLAAYADAFARRLRRVAAL
jgi:hypothetical protein